MFMPEYVVALRFATVLRESGTDGSGGAADDDVDVAVVVLGAVLLVEPVSPTEALVAPVLVSHGFGGDGEDMLSCESTWVVAGPLRANSNPSQRDGVGWRQGVRSCRRREAGD